MFYCRLNLFASTMAAQSIRLPDTLANWPWPRTLNPHYEIVKAETDAWFRSFNALTPKALLAFEKCDFCSY